MFIKSAGPALRTFALCLLGTLAVTPLFAQPADTVVVNLEEAVLRALSVSPDIDVVRAQKEYAEARSRLARASRFATEFNATTAHAVAPGLDVPADNTFPRDALYLNPDVRNDWGDLRPFNRFEVELVQPLYTWGELGGNIRAARHGVDLEAAGVEKQRLDVAARTADLYYNVLLTEELYRLAERAGDIVQQAKREIRRLLDEGADEVDDADLFQVQITEQEFNRRVVEVQQQRQTARAALARQLFLPPGTIALTEQDVLEPIDLALDSLPDYFDLALANRPEIAQAQAGFAARDALVDVARSGYYPKLFLGVSADYKFAAGRERQPNPYIGDPFRSRSVRAGLGFRQNLNFAQTRAKVDQAEAQRNEVHFQMEAARQLILFEVEEAYRKLLIAHAALTAQNEALRISKEWLRTEQINFDLDLGDTENLVRAVQANLELEARYYEAVRDYNTATLNLLRRAGTLTRRAQSGTLVD